MEILLGKSSNCRGMTKTVRPTPQADAAVIWLHHQGESEAKLGGGCAGKDAAWGGLYQWRFPKSWGFPELSSQNELESIGKAMGWGTYIVEL